ERVAIGTDRALIVASSDGSAPRWATEPVAGAPAWSTDGTAVAYRTGGGAYAPLRIATAGAGPVRVPAAAAAGPLGFGPAGSTVALVFTAREGVSEVGFAGWSEALPSTPQRYAAEVIEAWVGADGPGLGRLT